MSLEVEITADVSALVTAELVSESSSNENSLDANVTSVPSYVREHISNKNNPHETNATKTPYSNTTSGLEATSVQGAIDELAEAIEGAGNVNDVKINNSSIVSSKIAQIAADGSYDATNNKIATQSTVSNYHDATKADASTLTSHTSNTNNPHNVTKAQVGLGNVENKIMDSTPTASSANYVTSGGVKTYVDTYGGKIDKIKINNVEQTISSADKSVNFSVDGTYDASSNKIASQTTVSSAIEDLDSSQTAESGYALAGITETDGKLTGKTQIKIPSTPVEVGAEPAFNDGSATIASESNNIVTIKTAVNQSGGAISAGSDTISLGTAAKKTALTGDIDGSSTTELINASQAKNNIVDNVTTTSTIKSLSANMGKELQDQINNLKQRGRFLSLWNCSTGLPTSAPTVSPYTYKTGDYYIVTAVAGQGGTNYKPNGPTYTTDVPSTTVESAVVAVNDVYYYDSTNWSLQKNTIDLSTFVTNVAYNSNNNKLTQTRNGVASDITTVVTSVNGSSGAISGLVSTTSQSFTDEEKAQARTNIGLGNVDNTSDANKPISTAMQTALNNKVDKESGKGLSKNDFTDAFKSKLEGIQDGAEVNVQSDWNESNTSSDAYIQNKPNIIEKSGSFVSGNFTATDANGKLVDSGKNTSSFTYTAGTGISVVSNVISLAYASDADYANYMEE